MSEITVEQKIEEWNTWLGKDPNAEATIFKELIDLARIKYVFQGVYEMVDKNEVIQQHSLFYEVFSLNYAHSVLMYLRRQVQPQGISMRRLLDDIYKHHELVTRQWYMNLYTTGESGLQKDHLERHGNSVFTAHFGGSGDKADVLDLERIQADIDRLQVIRASISDFINWRIAHARMSEPEQVPTYNQIDEWADLLEDLFKKYILLLQGSGMSQLMPVPTHDWKAIFKSPWLPERDST